VVASEAPVEVTIQPGAELAVAVDALTGENLVLVDETGTEVPLASNAASQALTSGDPWFLANDGSGNVIGYTTPGETCAPAVSICKYDPNPVQAAINDHLSDGQDITIDGHYSEQIKIINKNVNLIGATSGVHLVPPTGGLSYITTMDGTDLFGLIYISGGTVNLYGLQIDGSDGHVSDHGSSIYAG